MAVRSRAHLSAYVGIVAEVIGVTHVARMSVACPSVHINLGVEQRCSAT